MMAKKAVAVMLSAVQSHRRWDAAYWCGETVDAALADEARALASFSKAASRLRNTRRAVKKAKADYAALQATGLIGVLHE